MTVDSSPVKFTPALPGQPVPEIRTISGGRPVFRARATRRPHRLAGQRL